MKINTCSVHKERIKGQAQMQITFDEDYNLPDYKPDISSMILKQGSANIDEIKVSKGQVAVKGILKFDVLYRAEQNSLGFCSSSGSAFFQENIAVDGAEEFDHVSVNCVLEDLTIHITNSRKLAIRGLIQLDVSVSELIDIELPEDVEDANAQLKKQAMTYLTLKDSKRDQCRVHEEMELPGNKLNIQEVIWKSIGMESIDCTPMEGCIQVKGELEVFCLYQGEPGIRMEWFENRIPVVCKIETADARPDVICHVKIAGQNWGLQIQEDLEGENRRLVIDGHLKVEYRIFEEEKREIIRDLYALDKTLKPVTEPLVLEQLLVKNNSRCKVSEMLPLESGKKEILQICNCSGSMQIDRQEIAENGIVIEGALLVQVLYMTQEDEMPIDALEGMIPFQYKIEVPGITNNCRYDLGENLNLLTVMMKNSNLLEVQAVMEFQTIVYQMQNLENIKEITEQPLNLDSVLSLPGLTGIRLKAGEDLWSTAKENHTTIDAIRQTNPDLEEPVRPGTLLLLIKQVG